MSIGNHEDGGNGAYDDSEPVTQVSLESRAYTSKNSGLADAADLVQFEGRRVVPDIKDKKVNLNPDFSGKISFGTRKEVLRNTKLERSMGLLPTARLDGDENNPWANEFDADAPVRTVRGFRSSVAAVAGIFGVRPDSLTIKKKL